MRSRRTARAALVVLFALAAAVAAFVSLLWPQDDETVALSIELPDEASAVRPFAVDGVEGWLVRREDGGVDAFSARSPQRRCRVELLRAGDPRLETDPPLFEGEPGGFFDPCSNSFWLLSGEHVFGPAPRDLDRFPAAEGEAYLLVDLGRVLSPRRSPTATRQAVAHGDAASGRPRRRGKRSPTATR